MLRRKLLIILSSVIVLLMILAVAALVSLQSIFGGLNHINTQTNKVVDLANQLSSMISRVEISLHELRDRKTHHLDPLIDSVQRMRQLNRELGGYYVVHREPMAPVYSRMCDRLNQFERQVGTLATTEDPELAARHNLAALTDAAQLRDDMLRVAQFAHQHGQDEMAELTGRFRVLVVAIAAGFLLVINISILVLLRSANIILRPMDKLLEATRELAMEHFHYRVDLSQRDEFDELAQAYNHLASQLEQNEQRKIETLQQVALTLNHELNNAAAVIDLQLRLLRRQVGDKQAMETCLTQIHQTLGRMTRVVQTLKNVRRIVLTDYVGGVKMLDLEQSSLEPLPETQEETLPGTGVETLARIPENRQT
ncbi:MAG: HAMP domain-containing protein [Phycisphaeraceae bacterium]